MDLTDPSWHPGAKSTPTFTLEFRLQARQQQAPGSWLQLLDFDEHRPSIVELTSPTSGRASHSSHTFSSLFQARPLFAHLLQPLPGVAPTVRLSSPPAVLYSSPAFQPFSHQPHVGADTSAAGHYCDPPSPDPA
ncbi:hypothetical protein D7B24_007509 [Verticillium nonalfalfae]|uniref:Uncharacterized protein n=1 Tax=Verticillium nonalfalfae TaxID=1051616 RepID=A0A3M9YK52_9PEZI|nr:uncharacterized protein D7B24_007509 [Verticillium nonalfalfae]RNJ60585.1 hypothetical protein D7B24_007509 [Verticillium nonalfalfae]